MRKKLLIYIIGVLSAITISAQEESGHTAFVGLPLDMEPQALMDELKNRGLQPEDSLTMKGRIAGVDVWVQLNCGKDSTRTINSILMTTRHQQGRTLRDDYKTLMKWMHRRYGAPNWESTVRGHSFARWFVDYDRDIVMIATAQPSVEIWFYDNHKVRNIDYYSILKHCERNPVGTVPFMTAQEQVTWKSTAVPTAKKTVKKGKQSVRRGRKAVRRTRKATKSRKRRR